MRKGTASPSDVQILGTHIWQIQIAVISDERVAARDGAAVSRTGCNRREMFIFLQNVLNYLLHVVIK